MSELELFSALIGDIYDASLNPTLWRIVLDQICRFVGGSAAHLFVQDSVSKAANVSVSWGDDPAFTRSYVDTYARLNPMFPGAIFFDVEQVHQLVEIIPRSELCQTRFAVEWMQPQGYIDDVFCLLEKSATSSSLCQVIRHRRDGVTDAATRQRMATVAPHIRRAVLIGKVIDLKTVEAAALADSLDTLASGMFLVDAVGRIVHANLSGHLLLSEGHILHAAGGKLGAYDPAADQALLDSFAAAGGGDTLLGRKGVAVPLNARDGTRYVANVLPLTAGERRKAGTVYAAVATVFVTQAAIDLPSLPEVIAEAFQLTPAEIRVLFAIVGLGNVPEVAAMLGLSQQTVKTHLRHLFDKTGTHRQTELVKLVAGYSHALLG